jgi:hypothetical protein
MLYADICYFIKDAIYIDGTVAILTTSPAITADPSVL